MAECTMLLGRCCCAQLTHNSQVAPGAHTITKTNHLRLVKVYGTIIFRSGCCGLTSPGVFEMGFSVTAPLQAKLLLQQQTSCCLKLRVRPCVLQFFMIAGSVMLWRIIAVQAYSDHVWIMQKSTPCMQILPPIQCIQCITTCIAHQLDCSNACTQQLHESQVLNNTCVKHRCIQHLSLGKEPPIALDLTVGVRKYIAQIALSNQANDV